jgi:carboxymethylenebutenolidase
MSGAENTAPPVGEMTHLRMSDGATVGVYRTPASGARRGGLVLLQEIFGLTEHIRDLCHQFAAEGLEVLAPALFDREARGLQASYSAEDVARTVRIAREEHPFATSVADVQTCVDALRAGGPVFVVGYCYGGSLAWAAACRCDGVAAVSGYYGSLVPALSIETPRCPVILHFGRDDESIPMEAVELVQARQPGTAVFVYPARHGFNSD